MAFLTQTFQANLGTVSTSIRPWPAPSESFPMHHSLSSASLAPDANSPDIVSILKQQNLHPQMHAYKCIILKVLAYFTLKTLTERHTVLHNVTVSNIHNNPLPLENKTLTVNLVKIKITQGRGPEDRGSSRLFQNVMGSAMPDYTESHSHCHQYENFRSHIQKNKFWKCFLLFTSNWLKGNPSWEDTSCTCGQDKRKRGFKPQDKKPVPLQHLYIALTAVATVYISKEYRVNFNNKYVWLLSTNQVLCRKQETEKNLHFYISEAVAVTLFICYNKCIGYGDNRKPPTPHHNGYDNNHCEWNKLHWAEFFWY